MPESPSPDISRRSVLGAGITGGAALVLGGLLAGPIPLRLGEPTGDPAITDALRSHLKGHRHVAIGVVDGSDARFGGFGTDENDEFEIGSITKTMTGLMLAQLVEEGSLSAETTVSDILGDRAVSTEVADVQLRELATHTSGLPRLAQNKLVQIMFSGVAKIDPYRSTPEETVNSALGASLNGRGKYAYSNLGTSFEGQLLALHTGKPWEDMLQERILGPLEMTSSYAPVTQDNLPDDAPLGHDGSGRLQGAWVNGGGAPSGGVRSTVGDMVRYLQAVRGDDFAGATRSREVLHDGDRTVAYHWFLDKEHKTYFHDGGTGGFKSFCGWNTATDRAVVILTDSTQSPDAVGQAILSGEVEL